MLLLDSPMISLHPPLPSPLSNPNAAHNLMLWMVQITAAMIDVVGTAPDITASGDLYPVLHGIVPDALAGPVLTPAPTATTVGSLDAAAAAAAVDPAMDPAVDPGPTGGSTEPMADVFENGIASLVTAASTAPTTMAAATASPVAAVAAAAVAAAATTKEKEKPAKPAPTHVNPSDVQVRL